MTQTKFPYLAIETSIVKLNLKRMVVKAQKAEVELRPHFKTHQSKVIGSWFREEGITGITVSSLAMAEFFAEDNWNDITIAFPASILDAERLNKLSGKITLNVLAVDPDTLKKLNQLLTNEIGIYIELDPGYGRSGVDMQNTSLIDSLLETINNSKYLTIKGFYSHAGHTYKCRSKEEIEALSTRVLTNLSSIKDTYDLPICYGDTPSCSVLNDFGAADQISPGNFIFYDWMQTQINSCTEDQIGVMMKCPVVAKYSDRNELLIHGGAVHFSKEVLQKPDGTTYFGIIGTDSENWIERPYLKSISQEHGIVSSDKEYFCTYDKSCA